MTGIYFKHAFCSYYEPEVFPGLVYRMQQPKVTLMVFVSGKVTLSHTLCSRETLCVRQVVLVGAKQYSHLVSAFESLYPSLLEFRKTDTQCDVTPDSEPPRDLYSLDNPSIQRILLHAHSEPTGDDTPT